MKVYTTEQALLHFIMNEDPQEQLDNILKSDFSDEELAKFKSTYSMAISQ